ncbi:MAG: penicillin-binding protein 1C, partial [Spirochaetaceae bacterium]|nr:penicillin-binding protein 1C [Spirochaetaceae bacterium]
FHPGVNPFAIVQAWWQTYIKKEHRMGASTITMQLAKLHYKLYTRDVPGKIKQILYSFYLERYYSKKEILEAYLNIAPCGRNIEGFPAAALYYFNKDISKLTVTEQLLLAVIPQDPLERGPVDGKVSDELIEARMNLFKSWVEKYPESKSLQSEMEMPVAVQAEFPFKALHLTDYLGSDKKEEGQIFHTTINWKLQNEIEKILQNYIDKKRRYGVHNGSVMVINHQTMEVLASVGSAAYFDEEIHGQVNGNLAKRSPGSTLKPFIYAMAMDQGLIIPDTLLKDAPTNFSEYTPDNYRSDFKGAIPAWQALVDSRNIPAITLANRIRNPGLYDFLIKSQVSGLQGFDHYGLSLVLGSAEVSMLELVRMYSVIANQGYLKEIIFEQDKVVSEHESRQLLSVQSSFLTRNMLEKNPPPPGYQKNISSLKWPVGFKTGTSIGFKDAWSIALYGPYIVCVWIGNFNGQGNSAFLGRTLATPLLFDLCEQLTLYNDQEYIIPQLEEDSIKKVKLCAVSGGIPNVYCVDLKEGWFIPGVSPIKKCDIHRQIYVDSRTGYRTDDRSSEFSKAIIREFWPTDLLQLFQEAGLPRITPPPYPPENRTLEMQNRGRPPEIISPLTYTSYILQKDSNRFQTIPLKAVADADATNYFWFAGSMLIGKVSSNETLSWAPNPGTYFITVLDNLGRSDSIKITVETY